MRIALFHIQHPMGDFVGAVQHDETRQDPLIIARQLWGTAATYTKVENPATCPDLPNLFFDATKD